MPFQTFATLIALVIALAAATVALILFLTGGLGTASAMPLAVVSVVMLCASVILRRHGARGDK